MLPQLPCQICFEVDRYSSRLPRQAKSMRPKSKRYLAFVERLNRRLTYAMQLRSQFIHANLRLVVTMAKRYDRGLMPLSDLIQEGNLGLMHAVSRFNYRRGLRFSTYACWWIRHAIGRAIADKSRAVRVPVHMLEVQQQLTRTKQRLLAALGREPSLEEVATEANVSKTKLIQMNSYLLAPPLHLDSPVHHEDARSLGELLADPTTEDKTTEDSLMIKELVRFTRSSMDILTPIEADVIRQRFGLLDDEEKTFREIGDTYQLSRERIRQIQNTALQKLRRAFKKQQV